MKEDELDAQELSDEEWIRQQDKELENNEAENTNEVLTNLHLQVVQILLLRTNNNLVYQRLETVFLEVYHYYLITTTLLLLKRSPNQNAPIEIEVAAQHQNVQRLLEVKS